VSVATVASNNKKETKYVLPPPLFSPYKVTPPKLPSDKNSMKETLLVPKFLSYDAAVCVGTRTIRAGYIANLSSYALYYIAHTCPNLTTLELQYCDDISAGAVEKVRIYPIAKVIEAL
jgi:hypothetical protein